MEFLKNYRELKEVSKKFGDGERDFMFHWIYRRFSTPLLYLIRNLDFSPNVITSLSIVFAVVTGVLFALMDSFCMAITAAFFLNFVLTLDLLDGQYARYKGKTSEFGGWYDAVADCCKYVFFLMGLAIGIFYNFTLEHELILVTILNLLHLNGFLFFLETHPELIFILGMWNLGNLFLVYYVHATRYKLSFTTGALTKIPSVRSPKNYHIGIESLLYLVFTAFVLTYQTYLLFIFFGFLLPFLWIYPFRITYNSYRQSIAK